MTFFDLANSKLLFILVIIGLLYVLGYCAVFLRKAFQRCIELGIKKETIINVIKSSVAFSLVPSISIVIGFFSLCAAFGIPWSWWRLSVVGSVAYELMSADMAAKGVGYTDLGAMVSANDPKVFATVMFVMTIGIMAGMVILLFFGKKLTTGFMKAREKENNTWGIVMSSCFMLTIMAVFLPVTMFSDIVSALTLLTSAGITLILGIIIKKYNVKWLGNFVLAITLILGMAASVGWHALLG
ncbi:MAG: DUF5058 family protein [Peptostreptococcaceae bacterium]